MTINSFLEKFMGRKATREQQTAVNYEQLVRQIAAGGEPDPAYVERLLSDAGKDIDSLKRDVELQTRRIEWKQKVAQRPNIEDQFAQVQQQIAVADREFEEAERRHDDVTNPLYCTLTDLKNARNEADHAFSDLLETCEAPELRRQLEDVNNDIRKLDTAMLELRNQAKSCDDREEALVAKSERQLSRDDAKTYLDQANGFKQRAEDTRRSIKSHEKTHADLHKRREQLEQRMRDW